MDERALYRRRVWGRMESKHSERVTRFIQFIVSKVPLLLEMRSRRHDGLAVVKVFEQINELNEKAGFARFKIVSRCEHGPPRF